MKDILDKSKQSTDEKGSSAFDKIMKNEKVRKVSKKLIRFTRKNKRYLCAGVLFACYAFVLLNFTGEEFNAERIRKLNSKTVSGEKYVPDAEFEIDAYSEINEIIQEYFDAYVVADFSRLEAVATPISDMEKSYITTMSPFYEEYQNITCYTKHGLSMDSFIVSACFEIKFEGVEQPAPSMVLFYVQTDKEGSMYINNLYSDFNMMYAENAIDMNVYTALRKYTMQDDYLELYNLVEEEYMELIKENEDVYQMTKRTIPGTRQIWEDMVFYSGSTEDLEGTESTESTESGETTESTQNTESTQKPEQQPSTPPATQKPEQQPSTPPATQKPEQPDTTPQQPADSESPEPEVRKIKIVNVNNQVNVRAKASTDSEDIGDARNGEVFQKLGEETDASGRKWIKIKFYGNKVGYVLAKYTEGVIE